VPQSGAARALEDEARALLQSKTPEALPPPKEREEEEAQPRVVVLESGE